jgi:hypothetical protein
MKLSEEVKRYIRDTEFTPIATAGKEGVHLVSTWGGYGRDGYLFIVDDEHVAWPASEYFKTEENIKAGSQVQLLVALREEHNGYRIEGRATFLSQGEVFQRIKRRFAWARAAVLLEVQKYEKLLAEESAAGYLASHPEVRTPSGSAIWPE